MKIQYRDKEIIILSGVYEPAEDSFLMVEAVVREMQRSDSRDLNWFGNCLN